MPERKSLATLRIFAIKNALNAIGFDVLELDISQGSFIFDAIARKNSFN
jgi:hypothetical protein